MFESFVEYIWYLLWSPLKKIKKKKNAWWMLTEVIGGLFDDVKQSYERIRQNANITTCDDIMLQVHAADRGLSRYENESMSSYRKRIASYSAVCELGGTNAGIILAVKNLGYEDVFVAAANELKGCTDRWAEFYVILELKLGEAEPVDRSVLIQTVKSTKEVEALDNYSFEFCEKTEHREQFVCEVEYKRLVYLDGTWLLNGEYGLDGYDVTGGNGMVNKVITKKAREKMALARYSGVITQIAYIAVGNGGYNGSVLKPDEVQNELASEVVRKPVTGKKISDISYEYSIVLESNELVGTNLSELCLIDSNNDLITIYNFTPILKSDTEIVFRIKDVH